MNLRLQEDLLTLAVYSPTALPILRNSLTGDLFEKEPYREILGACFSFYDKYRMPPKDHVVDILNGKIDDRGYKDLVRNLYLLHESVNEKFVLNSLTEFVRQQSLKGALLKALPFIQSGDLDQAERVIMDGLKKRIDTFHPGIVFSDIKSLKRLFAEKKDDIPFTIGIPALDKRGGRPGRGEMLVFIAPPKRGKTWFLVNCAIQNVLERFKVLYVTLELSEEHIAKRFLQGLLKMTSNKLTEVKVPNLKLDELERCVGMDFDSLRPLPLNDPKEALKKLNSLEKLSQKFNFIVKQFPTGQLTVDSLNSFLDTLYHTQGFVPDLLLIDYADLMKLSADNLRIDTGRTYVNLRGIGVERNMAVVTCSQGNRESDSAKEVKARMVGEDFSKIGTADLVITYSRTDQERQIGLARLLVAHSRTGRDGYIVIVSQSYQTGQFCIDSAILTSNYFDRVEEWRGKEGDQVD